MANASIIVREPDGATREYALTNSNLVVGRGNHSAVMVRDSSVSREHLQIGQYRGRYFVRDLNSRNGTTVNGRPGSVRYLHSGDVIGIGSSTLRFLQRCPGTRVNLSVVDAWLANRPGDFAWKTAILASALMLLSLMLPWYRVNLLSVFSMGFKPAGISALIFVAALGSLFLPHTSLGAQGQLWLGAVVCAAVVCFWVWCLSQSAWLAGGPRLGLGSSSIGEGSLVAFVGGLVAAAGGRVLCCKTPNA